MRFAFSDDQLALRDGVHDLLAARCPADVVRAAWPEPDGDGQGPGAGARAEASQLDDLWQQLAELGLFGLLIPEADGGLGLSEVDAAIVLAETGYFAVPHPVVEAMCVVAPHLVDVAPTRAQVGWGPDRGSGLTGLVDGAVVDLGSEVHPDALATERATLGTAAQLIGLGRRMLDLTVSYATERHQFGAPIGSFQAVKHHLADARLALEFAAPAVWRAAWSLAHRTESAERDVSMAKSMAADAAHLVGRKALQCHGGIGYTVEYDLHLFLKRAWVLEKIWGDSTWHRRRVAEAIGV